jgi:hypothetical protein
VSKSKTPAAAGDSLTIEELAFTGPHAQIYVNDKEFGGQAVVPLMVAVEKGAIRDVLNDRGTTRIVVVGDSEFLGNEPIEAGDNRQFAENAINWLLERTELVTGPGEQAMQTFTVAMTAAQLRNVEWILLAAFPGAVLFLGVLVWLRRRR